MKLIFFSKCSKFKVDSKKKKKEKRKKKIGKMFCVSQIAVFELVPLNSPYFYGNTSSTLVAGSQRVKILTL